MCLNQDMINGYRNKWPYFDPCHTFPSHQILCKSWVLTQETEVSSNDMLSFEGQSPNNIQKFYRGMLSRSTLVGEVREGARSRGRRALCCSHRDSVTPFRTSSVMALQSCPQLSHAFRPLHTHRPVIGCQVHNKLSISAYWTIKS